MLVENDVASRVSFPKARPPTWRACSTDEERSSAAERLNSFVARFRGLGKLGPRSGQYLTPNEGGMRAKRKSVDESIADTVPTILFLRSLLDRPKQMPDGLSAGFMYSRSCGTSHVRDEHVSEGNAEGVVSLHRMSVWMQYEAANNTSSSTWQREDPSSSEEEKKPHQNQSTFPYLERHTRSRSVSLAINSHWLCRIA